MKLTRINVCTVFLAVVLAALVTPVYKGLAAQIPPSTSSMFKSLYVAFLYALQGVSAMYAARYISRWIFAHAPEART
ncbi:hypothetical protein [Burkholderia stabilis]|uniref:hypothetical protein n=1 Tax=Burkholderia stabilis TaxID=95485 RepID=UPI001F4B2639|nr:hypothetical protein [Burkholderia stabilis]